MHRLTGIPQRLGYRMPAEWCKHRATWMSWPFDDEMWHGQLHDVRREYAAFVKTLSRYEPVHLLVRDAEARATAETAFSGVSAINLLNVPLDDVWLRDNGPIFVRREVVDTNPHQDLPQLAAVNWQFNSWGQKYSWDLDNLAPLAIAKNQGFHLFESSIVMEGGSLEVNGEGLCLTTEQCLLSPMRNPTLGKVEIEKYLFDYLGIDQVVWLKMGLEGDHTDGHIDTISRFSGVDTVLTSVCKDRLDPNYDRMQENLEILKDVRLKDGGRLQIIELPLPERRLELKDGTRLPPTYANFYIANGAVLVPQYEDQQDSKALALLQQVFPSHKVIGLPSRAIITGGGSFHCLTQQEPASY